MGACVITNYGLRSRGLVAREGFEPSIGRLWAACSAAELPRNGVSKARFELARPCRGPQALDLGRLPLSPLRLGPNVQMLACSNVAMFKRSNVTGADGGIRTL